MGAVSNKEGFSRLLNYLGNVKAAIIRKIVRISFEKFLRLAARCDCGRDDHAGIFPARSPPGARSHVLELDEAAPASPN